MLDQLMNETNIIPIAKILKIQPDNTEYGNSILFEGLGKDVDGSIAEYSWRSDIDGIISRKATFEISTLSVGNHNIFFKVKDNYGDWSNEEKSSVIIKKSDKPINNKPIVITNGPYSSFVNEYIQLDGSNSYDPDGDEIIDYIWDFNNGITKNGNIVQYRYNNTGNYTIKLTITDANGASSIFTTYAIINERINNNPSDIKDENNYSLFYLIPIIIVIIIGILIIFKLFKKDWFINFIFTLLFL